MYADGIKHIGGPGIENPTVQVEELGRGGAESE
jgi:hypothetical protein